MNPFRSKSFRPAFEALENRLVPTTSFHVDGDFFYIDGDFWSDDHLLIKAHGAGGFTVTDATGASITVPAGKLLEVYTHFGNDTVRYKTDGSFNSNITSQCEVIMGAGDDHFTGTLNRDLSNGADIHLTVQGQGGADMIALYGTSAAPHRPGDDLTDGLAINTGGMSIASTSKLEVQLVGGGDNDRVYFNYEGQLRGQIALDAIGEDGNDTVKAGLSLANGSTGSVHGFRVEDLAQVGGGAGSDALTFQIVDDSNGQASINALIKGHLNSDITSGFFTDTAHATSNVLVVNCETVTLL